MRKKRVLSLAATACMVMVSIGAMAVGLGGYMTVGGGGATYSYNQYELYTSKSLYDESKKSLAMNGYEFYMNLSVMYRLGS